jgi:putative tricarboxylic transport membrane protein
MAQQTDTQATSEEGSNTHNSGIDALISIAISLGAILFLINSGQYAGVRTATSDPGAAFWPRVVLVVILLSSLVNLAQILSRDDIVGFSSISSPLTEGFNSLVSPSEYSDENTKYAASILLLIGYIALLSYFGFLLTTAVFLSLLVWILGYRPMWKVAVFGSAVSLLVFILFRNFMNIALPYGVGIFRELGVIVGGII